MRVLALCTMLMFVALWWQMTAQYRWIGIVYPDKTNLSQSIQIGKFASLERCRAASIATIRKAYPNGDYECG